MKKMILCVFLLNICPVNSSNIDKFKEALKAEENKSTKTTIKLWDKVNDEIDNNKKDHQSSPLMVDNIKDLVAKYEESKYTDEYKNDIKMHVAAALMENATSSQIDTLTTHLGRSGNGSGGGNWFTNFINKYKAYIIGGSALCGLITMLIVLFRKNTPQQPNVAPQPTSHGGVIYDNI